MSSDSRVYVLEVKGFHPSPPDARPTPDSFYADKVAEYLRWPANEWVKIPARDSAKLEAALTDAGLEFKREVTTVRYSVVRNLR